MNPKTPLWIEQQVTHGAYGHFLNPVQAFSPDDQWIVHVIRNEDSQIARTGGIERVHLDTGQQDTVYQTTGQSFYGPGVGAVAFAPHTNHIIFIHGLLPDVNPEYSDLHGIQWSRSGAMFTYNRKVKDGDSAYYQIFKLHPDEL